MLWFTRSQRSGCMLHGELMQGGSLRSVRAKTGMNVQAGEGNTICCVVP